MIVCSGTFLWLFSLAWDDVQLTLKVGFICPVIKFPPPILEHFCPLLAQIEQMGLILPRWGLTLPRIPPPTPVLYSAVIHPLWGYVHTQNKPKPTQNTRFSWPEPESGQNKLPSGQFKPNWPKCLKGGQISRQNISRSGRKNTLTE